MNQRLFLSLSSSITGLIIRAKLSWIPKEVLDVPARMPCLTEFILPHTSGLHLCGWNFQLAITPTPAHFTSQRNWTVSHLKNWCPLFLKLASSIIHASPNYLCWGSKSLCVFTCSLNSVSLIPQKLRISYFLSHGFTVFSKCSLVCQFLCFLQLLYSFFFPQE